MAACDDAVSEHIALCAAVLNVHVKCTLGAALDRAAV
jgi:hypothetical protein